MWHRLQMLRPWLAVMPQHGVVLFRVDGVERMRLLCVVGHAPIMPE